MKMAADFCAWIEGTPGGLVHDEKLLPHPKTEIFDSLLFAIANSPDRRTADRIRFCALRLARYQEDVGSEPIRLPDIDSSAVSKMTSRQIEALWATADYPSIGKFLLAVGDDLQFMLEWTGLAKAANPRFQPLYKRAWQRFRQQGRYSPFAEEYVDFSLGDPEP